VKHRILLVFYFFSRNTFSEVVGECSFNSIIKFFCGLLVRGIFSGILSLWISGLVLAAEIKILDPRFFGIVNTNDLKFVVDVEDPRINELAQKVVGIHYEQVGRTRCTGFFISTNRVLTNRHCFDHCSQLSIWTKYLRRGEFVKKSCTRFVWMNWDLDAFVFEVEDDSRQTFFELSEEKHLEKDTRLLILSHPRGQPLMVDQSEDCKVLNPDFGSRGRRLNNLLHGCDTLPMSSGSPLIDYDSGKVVGLHWGDGMNDPLVRGNFAIPAHLIRAAIEAEDSKNNDSLMVL
jgi:hypothetical protein